MFSRRLLIHVTYVLVKSKNQSAINSYMYSILYAVMTLAGFYMSGITKFLNLCYLDVHHVVSRKKLQISGPFMIMDQGLRANIFVPVSSQFSTQSRTPLEILMTTHTHFGAKSVCQSVISISTRTAKA